MPLFDMPLEKLREYQAPNTEPADFDAFWQNTLKEAGRFPLDPTLQRQDDSIYQLVDVYDLTFAGYNGDPIKGWFIEPAGNTRRLPCLITYVGYGGGRSLPVDHFAPVVAGFAHLVMDNRGQGSCWAPGGTGDVGISGGHYPGFMTLGIESPETYYYRRLYVDAVRAVDVAATHPHVNAARIAVGGGSQGGGLSIAAAALAQRKVKLVLADVPFLCHIRRAVEMIEKQPYQEIIGYLKTHRNRIEQVYRTLAYFDGVNFAPRITARCLFSAGMMDQVCPPSTIFAAYNRIKTEKDIRLYTYNEHEGGGPFQVVEKLRLATQYL